MTKECYSIKLDLLTNATVVDDAIIKWSSRADHGSITSPCEICNNKLQESSNTACDIEQMLCIYIFWIEDETVNTLFMLIR